MKSKLIPTRMCIICRSRHPKNELVKIVKNKNGEIKLDKTCKNAGRGAYICKSEECQSKLIKTRALNRTFKTEVPMELYEKIICEIKGEN